MRELIQFHIDELDIQQAREQQFANTLNQKFSNNKRAFSHFIPSLARILESGPPERKSIFVNKFAEPNIVDYTNGRVFYGQSPASEVKRHVKDYQRAALKVPCHQNKQHSSAPLERLADSVVLPKEIEVLVVLGLGLGHALDILIKEHDLSHILIYEPDIDLFKCACFVQDWQSLLRLCAKKNIALYFQIGEDASNLVGDILELQQHFSFSEFFVYRHYHTAVFDSLVNQFTRGHWTNLSELKVAPLNDYTYLNFNYPWGTAIPDKSIRVESKKNDLFERNFAALENFFPEIASQYKNYSPKIWHPIRDGDGQFNMLNDFSQSVFSHDPLCEVASDEFRHFSQFPNKNGVVLGYTGEKLRHYAHYQFVINTELLIDEVEEEVAELPKVAKSIIMFGLGAGDLLAQLLDNHDVENLFICEPNSDFFYASLFNIDWHAILHKIDQSEHRLYINIGDNGSNITRGLIRQFYSLGPYLLAQTYVVQSYVNKATDAALHDLQEQLKLLLSMGDYFDHAFYGINHTRSVIEKNAPMLLSNPHQRLSYSHKKVPIVLVGNGPSLDSSLSLLKTVHSQSIIVSCGTALKTLYENDVIPDFHCEIEQNRATFDWACRVGSFDYLKKVSLLSCNGIHPDTCALYKEVFFCFKEGEASTVAWTSIINSKSVHVLPFAFPTVANFAFDVFSAMNPNEIYLVGIDLGYTDLKKHHSQSSGYYDDSGEQLYDYVAKNHAVLEVEGNFSPTVYTKHEFKIAKMVLEEAVKARPTDVYNCSDGAMINGTRPLSMDYVIVSTTPSEKNTCVDTIKKDLFSNKLNAEIVRRFDALKDTKALEHDAIKILDIVKSFMSSTKSVNVDELIEEQRSVLIDSVKNNSSLIFYYLYGSVNYASAVLSKLSSANQTVRSKCLPKVLSEWETCLTKVVEMFSSKSLHLDNSSSMRWLRIEALTKTRLQGKRVLLSTNSTSFIDAFRLQCRQLDINVDLTVTGLDHSNCTDGVVFDSVVYYLTAQFDHCQFLNTLENNSILRSKSGNGLIVFDYPVLESVLKFPKGVTVMEMDGDIERGSNRPFSHVSNAAFHVVNGLCSENSNCFVLPKIILKNGNGGERLASLNPNLLGYRWFESNLWLVGTKTESFNEPFDGFGDRLEEISGSDLPSQFTVADMSDEEIAAALHSAQLSSKFIFRDKEHV
ncbi:motility associated factor glycosyltransferase family protein [Alteromonas oceanisediminis]|uniref:motility associated factor glycosyltransferase family protein n=1 Tax=Alteromonas oceanisediminis TaxID=2836180 RepID=UPI001BD99E81|nr:6-hydroxymethylpterin diphosphokinase MptE-like protein [Alteromonas oceanisediminis]MBT0584955.1 DUF115 domain-containing protein [Alteromonas oceanisediminis]